MKGKSIILFFRRADRTLAATRRAALALLVMMLTTATAWSQTVYTVTLTAGDGSGNDVTLNSTDNYYGESDSGDDVFAGKKIQIKRIK